MPFKSTRRGALLLPLLVLSSLLLAIVPARCGYAEPLGRLFFTPAERHRIDRPVRSPEPPAPPPRLDGIVTRSAGRPTVFLDGEAIHADARQIRIDTATARVTGPDGRSHRLRVGDPPPDTP